MRGRNGATGPLPFEDRIDKSGGPDACWPWTGTINSRGYGNWWNPETRSMAVASREAARRAGMDIDGAQVLHACDNPPCCNPAHLRVGDHAENMADMVARGRARNPTADRQRALTHCKRGHEFNAENTHRRPDGARSCLACRRVRYLAAREES